MKQLVCLALCLLSLNTQAQNNPFFRNRTKVLLEKAEMEEEIDRFRQEMGTDMNRFRDSVNAAFAKFLAENWVDFELLKREAGFKPRPKPVCHNPQPQPTPEPNPQPKAEQPKPQPTPQPKPAPQPKPTTPQPAPQPKPQPAPQPKPQPAPQPKPTPQPAPKPQVPTVPSMSGSFYGRPFYVERTTLLSKHLSSTSNSDVSKYWAAIARLDVAKITTNLQSQCHDLSLDEWGTYQLAYMAAPVYATNMTENERAVFTVFLLNQLGYKAKIGCAEGRLYVLLSLKEAVWNTPYFRMNGDRYYVMNPKHRKLKTVSTVSVEHPLAKKTISLAVQSLPTINPDYKYKKLQFGGKTYRIKYNQRLVDYFATYPCTEHRVYGISPVDDTTLQSLKQQLEPEIQGKSQTAAINFLLHFVQNSFEYKTDDDQFGYEKWNFAEETIASDYSDCDDRAVLFAQLVRKLLGMKVVLVNYPGEHLATAVLFDDPAITGDGFTHKGRRYIICDPTYVNANYGMAMPDLTSNIEVIEL